MKKEKKVEFGIEITKPWSKEMYDHNDRVAEQVKAAVHQMWMDACNKFQAEMGEEFMSDMEWISEAPKSLKDIQVAITGYGFRYGYDVASVSSIVEEDLEDAPYYRLKEIAEDLELDLKQGFVGFN